MATREEMIAAILSAITDPDKFNQVLHIAVNNAIPIASDERILMLYNYLFPPSP